MVDAAALPGPLYSPPEREAALASLASGEFDVLVVGAGINGAVAAAALAGSGVRVAVIDRSDFASGVSSQSSNLAWGGIKYLESGDFGLVRKLCLSRNRLMDAYPSSVREIRFFASIRRGFRLWSRFVWLGALLYWLMGNCRMAMPRYLSRRTIEREAPVVDTEAVVGGLEYSDCYLVDNDARFVFGFLRQAMDAGAVAANYLSADDLQWSATESRWDARLQDKVSGRSLHVKAKVIVNAAGPWVDAFNAKASIASEHHHALSKGIHLIVERVTPTPRVLTFFASDGRLFFVIPMGSRTCIGTTDTQVADPAVGVTTEDRDFVLANANYLLKLDRPLTAEDVIAERVGVRPLALAGERVDRDWVQLSRKHVIEVDAQRRYLSIFGGKLTDCLNVGQEVVEHVRRLAVSVSTPEQPWYGEPGSERLEQFQARAQAVGLDRLTPSMAIEPLSERFWRRYGEQAFELLEAIEQDPRQAESVLEDFCLTRAELPLIASREMVVCLEDYLRRRSMISLTVHAHRLAVDPGLEALAEALFGERAPELLADYLHRH